MTSEASRQPGGEGQNSGVNRGTTSLLVGRLALRPLVETTLAASVARYRAQDVRLGFDSSVEWRGAVLRAEHIRQLRAVPGQDYGWFGLAAYRLRPWVQLVAEEEDMVRRLGRRLVRNDARTLGVNLDFGAARTRLVVDYVARAVTPNARRDAWVSQLQVRF